MENKLLFGVICCLFCASSALAMNIHDLIAAARTNDVAAIRSYPGDVNEKAGTEAGGIQFNALHEAISSTQKKAVLELLKKGANPDLARTYKMILTGRSRSGCIPNAENCSESPLHIAVAAKDEDIVASLIHAHAALNVKNSIGRTPLFDAARQGLTTIACELIAAGADPKIGWGEYRNAFQVAPDATRKEMKKYVRMLKEGNALPLRLKDQQDPALYRLWHYCMGFLKSAV